jgi:hypothetical protein
LAATDSQFIGIGPFKNGPAIQCDFDGFDRGVDCSGVGV